MAEKIKALRYLGTLSDCSKRLHADVQHRVLRHEEPRRQRGLHRGCPRRLANQVWQRYQRRLRCPIKKKPRHFSFTKHLLLSLHLRHAFPNIPQRSYLFFATTQLAFFLLPVDQRLSSRRTGLISRRPAAASHPADRRPRPIQPFTSHVILRKLRTVATSKPTYTTCIGLAQTSSSFSGTLYLACAVLFFQPSLQAPSTASSTSSLFFVYFP